MDKYVYEAMVNEINSMPMFIDPNSGMPEPPPPPPPPLVQYDMNVFDEYGNWVGPVPIYNGQRSYTNANYSYNPVSTEGAIIQGSISVIGLLWGMITACFYLLFKIFCFGHDIASANKYWHDIHSRPQIEVPYFRTKKAVDTEYPGRRELIILEPEKFNRGVNPDAAARIF